MQQSVFVQKLYKKKNNLHLEEMYKSLHISSGRVKRSRFLLYALCASSPIHVFFFTLLCSTFLSPSFSSRRSFKLRPVSLYSSSKSLSLVSFCLTYSSHDSPLRRANGEFRSLLNCNNFNQRSTACPSFLAFFLSASVQLKQFTVLPSCEEDTYRTFIL